MTLSERLSRQLFLSTMLNRTDAAYAVERGEGAGLIQLGTMLVAPDTADYAPYRERWPKAFLPNDRQGMVDALRQEIVTVRAGLGEEVALCLSIGGFQIEDVVQATDAFRQAGGDFVELNVHGRLDPFADQGYFAGMALPRYRDRLVTWVEQLAQVDIPLLLKFRTDYDVDFDQVLDDLGHIPLFGHHFNVRLPDAEQPNLVFVGRIRPLVQGVLLCSGYAWDAETVEALFGLGVDAVGVAQPVIRDRDFIAKMAAAIG